MPKECSELNTFQSKFFILLLRNESQLSKWETIFDKCKTELSEEIRELVNPAISNLEIKKRYYSKLGEDPSRKENVLLVKAIRSYFSAKNINEREKIYLNEVFTNKSYLGILFSTYLNLEYGNISGASLYLKKLINISPHFLVLDIEELLEPSKRRAFKDTIIKILIKIWDSSINEHLKNLYFETLSVLEDSEISELQTGFLGGLLKAKSSFSIEDYRYSISFAKFWISRINEENAKVDLVHKFFNSPAFYDIEISEYDIFSLATPSDHVRREYIFNNIKNNWKNLEYYEKEAIFTALENPVFRKELMSVDPIFKVPLFNFKKEEFKNDVSFGRYRVYSIFKLLELGYEDEHMLGYLL